MCADFPNGFFETGAEGNACFPAECFQSVSGGEGISGIVSRTVCDVTDEGLGFAELF